MALNTIDTYLLQGTGTPATYSKIVDIKDYPDIFGEKELLEVTTLSDTQRKYIEGLQNGDALEFTCNYDLATFNSIKALDTGSTIQVRVAFGKSGSTYGVEGAFDFDAYISVRISGKGVNEVREMIVRLIVASDISVTAVSA